MSARTFQILNFISLVHELLSVVLRDPGIFGFWGDQKLVQNVRFAFSMVCYLVNRLSMLFGERLNCLVVLVLNYNIRLLTYVFIVFIKLIFV